MKITLLLPVFLLLVSTSVIAAHEPPPAGEYEQEYQPYVYDQGQLEELPDPIAEHTTETGEGQEPEAPPETEAQLLPLRPYILSESENSVVFAGLYIQERALAGDGLEAELMGITLSLPPALLLTLGLEEGDRFTVEVRRPTAHVFTLRFLLGNTELDGVFPAQFTAALPWAGEYPRVTDPDGNILPAALEDGVVVVRLNAGGSYILSEAPPPPPPVEEDEYEEEYTQEFRVSAVVIVSALLALLCVVVFVGTIGRKLHSRMRARASIRRRLYKQRQNRR